MGGWRQGEARDAGLEGRRGWGRDRGRTAAAPAREVGTRQPKVAAAAARRMFPRKEAGDGEARARDGAWGTGQGIRLRPWPQCHPTGKAGPPISGQVKFAHHPLPPALPSSQPCRWVGRLGPRAHLRLGGELDHRLSEIQLGVGRPHTVGARSGRAPAPTPAPAWVWDPAPAPRPPLLSQEQSRTPRPPARRRPRPFLAPPRQAPPSRHLPRSSLSTPGVQILPFRPKAAARPSHPDPVPLCPSFSVLALSLLHLSHFHPSPGPTTLPAFRPRPHPHHWSPSHHWVYTFSASPFPWVSSSSIPVQLFFFPLSICSLGSPFSDLSNPHVQTASGSAIRSVEGKLTQCPCSRKAAPGLRTAGGPSGSHNSFLDACLP